MKYLLATFLTLLSFTAYADSSATLWAFSGRAALNAGSAPKKTSHAYQIEQETPIGARVWDLGYLNEGNLSCKGLSNDEGCKRDGLYGMLKIPFNLTKNLETSVAAGPYINATTRENGAQYVYTYGVSMLTALSIVYHVTDNLAVQARYQHAFISSDGRDTDQFFLAAGWSPSFLK